MTKLFKITVKLRIVRLSDKWLQKKMESNDIEAIAFGLQYGLYNIRIPSVQFLGKIDSEISRKALKRAIDDPMKTVSSSAMESLESMICTDSTLNKIRSRKQYWAQIESEKLNRLNAREKLYIPDPKDRPSRKSFENLKQMLRKSINSGKWF